MRFSWVLLVAGVLASLQPLSQAQLNLGDLSQLNLGDLGVDLGDVGALISSLNASVLEGLPLPSMLSCVNYIFNSPSGSSAWRSCQNGKYLSGHTACRTPACPTGHPKHHAIPVPCSAWQQRCGGDVPGLLQADAGGVCGDSRAPCRQSWEQQRLPPGQGLRTVNCSAAFPQGSALGF